jgi:class 3 adenylate cyclase
LLQEAIMSPTGESLLRPQDLLALLDASTQLNSFETLDRALRQMLAGAARLTGSESGSVILYDEPRNDFYFAAATGPFADQVRAIRIPMGKGSIAEDVFRKRQPVLQNHVTDHYRRVDDRTGSATRSMICVPLVQGDRAFGVMQLLNKGRGEQPFTEQDLELASRFAVHAAVAIRNALLFEQMISSSGLMALPEVRDDLIGHILSKDSPPVRERLTILSSDMRGFTRLATALVRPEKLQRLLGDHLGMMSAAVLKYRGIVNKFIGDGMMAIFRGDAAATNAIQAAFEIVEGFERLREVWAESSNFNLEFLDIGVGIATDDEIVFGRIGDDRFCEMTVVGVGVNLAAALQKSARDGKRVLCDYQTLRRLADRSTVIADPPAKFQLMTTGAPTGMTFDVYPLRRPPKPGPAGKDDRYDVFVSYRREGGSGAARALQQGLGHDCRVFLDVDRLRGGLFDATLLKTIEATPNFLVVLSPGSLDRCHLPDDWLRQEIRQALRTGRTIIPVALEGFAFPPAPSLPEDMRDVLRHDAVEYSHRYFDAMLAKVRERLTGVRKEAP